MKYQSGSTVKNQSVLIKDVNDIVVQGVQETATCGFIQRKQLANSKRGFLKGETNGLERMRHR